MIPEALRSPSVRYLINPAGRFEIGGPQADAGLTGRKIIVDTYGGCCPHGGGAFSGKDPTKVNRSGAYAARWIAKHLVSAGLARWATLQLSYVIGQPDPVSLLVDTHGTGKVSDETLEWAVRGTFDFSVDGIVNDLSLQVVSYYDTAAYGHVGREDIALPWERTPRIRQLQEAAGVIRRSPPDQQRLTRFLLESLSPQGLSATKWPRGGSTATDCSARRPSTAGRS
ncbi:methionine adenosyltransferase domain-containing protein [Halomonas sp. LR5S13]|uniref:methionine adenosyltransferase domain-containing protein n=1 Tax=Halomonas rhizosphaerae TaxID=3043296 RepID=UPI0024A7A991|nr:methionine adenosyltransferase domain-containing protein [Halomonas rhizosphaerae]MDI5922701.1 methionine adenosyltransferase domain-containing protein [Halomonas rhizosphaerae]